MYCIVKIVLLYLAAGVLGNVTIIYRSPKEGKDFSNALLAKEDSIVVGGRDFFSYLKFSISQPHFNETTSVRTVDVAADDDILDQCLIYYEEYECPNNIRVLHHASSEQLLVCGTNARQAKCFYYNMTTNQTVDVEMYAGTWLTDAKKTTTLFCGTDPSDQTFYVTSQELSIAEFQKVLPKRLVTPNNRFLEAEFKAIYEFSKKEFVYVFFNEESTYFSGEEIANGNTQRYSMVARACKNDEGGSFRSEEWVTLNKLRLLCPWPGTQKKNIAKFHYDELVATFQTESSVYGLFRPNRNWKLPTYAIAKYDIAKIDEYFDGVAFEDGVAHYVDENNLERVSKYTGSGSPFLPGQCPRTVPYTLRNEFEKFVKANTLIRATVNPVGNAPFHVEDDEVNYEFVFVREFNTSTSVFLLSRDGHMKKLVLHGDGTVTEIFQKRVIKNDDAILNAKIVHQKDSIVAVTPRALLSVPLSYCKEHRDCNSCIRDPHCYWNADRVNSEFSCEKLPTYNAVVERRCSATPTPPSALQANAVTEGVQVLWTSQDASPEIYSVMTVVLKKTKEVVKREKIASTQYLIARSELIDGCLYEVMVSTVNGNSFSEETRTSFHVDLTKPDVSYRYIDNIIIVEWPPVVGASHYKVQSYDSEQTTLREVAFHNVTSFYQPYLDDRKHAVSTIIVTAQSDDLVNSVTTVTIEPQTTAAGTTSSASTLLAETQPQSTTDVAELSTTHSTTVSTQPSTTTTVTTTSTPKPTRPVSRPTTAMVEEDVPDGRSFMIRRPVPTHASATDEAFRQNYCGYEVLYGVLVPLVILLFICVSIFIYNILYGIRWNSRYLRDNNDCEYTRKCCVFWRREPYMQCRKFSGADVGESRA